MIQQERLLKVLKAPHISEKATNNAEKGNTIVFKVALDANKVEIANAVEALFESGRRSDWKKAYVTLQEGQSLDFVEGAAE